MESVVCATNQILAIRRAGKERFIIHRYSVAGSVIDALRVDLPDLSHRYPKGKWPGVWTVEATSEDLTVTLGLYSYKATAGEGGVLDQSDIVTTRLPR